MNDYFKASICLKGHIATDTLEKELWLLEKSCKTCGEPTIFKCPHCNTPIPGAKVITFECYQSLDCPPAYCYECGKAYPWTELAIKNAIIALQEANDLPEELLNPMIEVLPDLMSETPATNVATVRAKKIFESAGKFSCDILRQFVIDFGCELVKRTLLP